MNLLADLYQIRGKSAEALDLSKEAVTVMTDATDQNSPLLGRYLYKLAEVNRKQKNPGAAESNYIRARQLMQGVIERGKKDPSDLVNVFKVPVENDSWTYLSPAYYTNNLVGLASLYSGQKRSRDAEMLYKEALDTLDWINKAPPRRSGFWDDYIKRETYSAFVKSLRGYADFLRSTGRQQEAIEHEKRADEFKALLKNVPGYQEEDNDL